LRNSHQDESIEAMYSMDVSRRINAPRSEVYRALLDPEAIVEWRVPDGMTGQVHEFDAREGGRFRISLVYDEPDAVGKSAAGTDTYHGHFARLVPDEQVVEVDEFESDDADVAGRITVTTTLADADGGGTDVTLSEGLPDSISREDNETGTRMSLDNLARLVEHAF
jgi:uncharacterized protein YndB with AHSA1/START domain